ncbi:MAG: tetratricopeptide repeat-containing protein, partial [Bradymonadaceae bacterium]|nr:tetratricopeptide repeat-containing protein [Lujinxingiaceae bacterium]
MNTKRDRSRLAKALMLATVVCIVITLPLPGDAQQKQVQADPIERSVADELCANKGGRDETVCRATCENRPIEWGCYLALRYGAVAIELLNAVVEDLSISPEQLAWVGKISVDDARYFRLFLDVYTTAKIPRSEAEGAELATAAQLSLDGTRLADAGQPKEALAHFERALPIEERVLGSDHPDVATSLNNIGNEHDNLGSYEKALVFYERALAIWKRALGPEHPDVATSLNNIGVAQSRLGSYEKALVAHDRALAIRERALGPDHPLVALSLNNLGHADYRLGSYVKALVFHERSLAIWERALGPDHPLVASGLSNIGLVYLGQSEPIKALAYFGRALDISERHFLANLHASASDVELMRFLATVRYRFDAVLSVAPSARGGNDLLAKVLVWQGLATRSELYVRDMRRLYEAAPEGQRKHLESLRSFATRELALVNQETTSKSERQALDKRLAALRKQKRGVEQTLTKQLPRFALLRQVARPEMAPICRALKAQKSALVSFVHYDHAVSIEQKLNIKPRYDAFVLDGACKPRRLHLGEGVVIDEAVSNYRQALEVVQT